jgi:hypothetical protein
MIAHNSTGPNVIIFFVFSTFEPGYSELKICTHIEGSIVVNGRKTLIMNNEIGNVV